ncbi:hypothetical protein AB6A40_008766 [Gnathostoma spinigerum]|uniref:Uncharacterized protein n=1 Tax=Gnathostoma spinigerum TaxID=75299 RepID=A0ABD6EZG3_9BILA
MVRLPECSVGYAMFPLNGYVCRYLVKAIPRWCWMVTHTCGALLLRDSSVILSGLPSVSFVLGYAERRSAKKAIEKMSGQDINGQTVQVTAEEESEHPETVTKPDQIATEEQRYDLYENSMSELTFSSNRYLRS